MTAFLRLAFHHFYTTFAWTYDGVAALVSFGEWQGWGRAALTQVPSGARVLELAHGPGHLHAQMREREIGVISLDLSAQMGRLLSKRMNRAKQPYRHVQADAQQLPFADAQFDCVLSTFPTGFIFAVETLREVRRVLGPAGRFIIVPSVEITSSGVLAALIRLAYRITGQHTYDANQMNLIRACFAAQQFGFVEVTVPTRHAQVAVWVCEKQHQQLKAASCRPR